MNTRVKPRSSPFAVCAALLLFLFGELAIAEAEVATSSHVKTINPAYSFTRAPFVHPRLVYDLETWLSDTGDQVVAINLVDANASNRYFGAVRSAGTGCPLVTWVEEHDSGDGRRFSYEYIGMTDHGVHVLATRSGGDGTLVATSVVFLSVAFDQGFGGTPTATTFRYDSAGNETEVGVIRADRQRILLRRLGELPLGDRWDGDLRVVGNDLHIGEDQGRFGHNRSQGLFLIDVKPWGALRFGADPVGCG